MNQVPEEPGPDRRRDIAGMIGWGLLLAVAAALLLSRFFGGGC